jgi:hypothetical protein
MPYPAADESYTESEMINAENLDDSPNPLVKQCL